MSNSNYMTSILVFGVAIPGSILLIVLVAIVAAMLMFFREKGARESRFEEYQRNVQLSIELQKKLKPERAFLQKLRADMQQDQQSRFMTMLQGEERLIGSGDLLRTGNKQLPSSALKKDGMQIVPEDVEISYSGRYPAMQAHALRMESGFQNMMMTRLTGTKEPVGQGVAYTLVYTIFAAPPEAAK